MSRMNLSCSRQLGAHALVRHLELSLQFQLANMDSAYDHIQEEAYPDDPPRSQAKDASAQDNNFNNEIQDAYKAISSSPWAARLGGFLGTVKKQGEQYYNTAQATASSSASAGLSNIIKRTRGLSIQNPDSAPKDGEPSTEKSADPSSPAHPDRPDSLPADIVKEAEGMLSRFRAEAAKRLVDIQKAEDAADEALLKFGTNIKSFLTEAVTIAPPSDEEGGGKGTGKVLFESKDSEGKRVVHATRFDAQLHVIHSSLDSFLKDPISPQWEQWKSAFDVDAKTDAISRDLEKHEELRRAMEKLVPEKVEYGTFWERYYFLRHIVETEEQRRREMLKASAPVNEEEVGWDEDSEDEEEKTSTPSNTKTPQAPQANLAASQGTLKPAAQPRRSNDDKSVADSDASYDLVSGASSRAPGSPQDKKKEAANEESDEEDWE
ncbi:hypothetical protein BDV96DRAFT_562145 [Lophiotrema nucula]|uniref:BSD domain-containing protein n=1 Tax=Lophiotrema nucula TaxID=690887 RepID=A0A6A5ZWU7_9PLEO|nr:hypothetical protein BDV96DRAFT_562145 [Lophiotrema nucula]